MTLGDAGAAMLWLSWQEETLTVHVAQGLPDSRLHARRDLPGVRVHCTCGYEGAECQSLPLRTFLGDQPYKYNELENT